MCRQTEEPDFIVAAGDAVGSHQPAAPAAVDERPLFPPSDPNTDRFHLSPAAGTPVSRPHVDVEAPQAMRTVIAVPCPIFSRHARDFAVVLKLGFSRHPGKLPRTDRAPQFAA